VSLIRFSSNLLSDSWLLDANTIGSVAAVASIDWGCAVQIGAAVSIGSDGSHSSSNGELLYALRST